MTDHLHRLAAHALDRLPSARPRVASRFEPVAVVDPAPADQDDPIFTAVQSTTAWVAPPPTSELEPRQSVSPRAEIPISAPDRTPDVSDAIAAAPRPLPADALAVRAIAEPPVVPTKPSPQLDGPPPHGTGAQEPMRVTPALRGASATEPMALLADRPGAGLPGTTNRRGTSLAAPVSVAEHQTAPSRPPADPWVVAALLAPLEADVDRVSHRSSFRGAGASRATTIQPTGIETTSPSVEPVVQVTIGRIEVRAIPTADASAPGPKAPAVMGLDAYLKRRSRGGEGDS